MQCFGHGATFFRLAQIIGYPPVAHIHIQASCAPEVKAFGAPSTRHIRPAVDREERQEKTVGAVGIPHQPLLMYSVQVVPGNPQPLDVLDPDNPFFPGEFRYLQTLSTSLPHLNVIASINH